MLMFTITFLFSVFLMPCIQTSGIKNTDNTKVYKVSVADADSVMMSLSVWCLQGFCCWCW